MKPVSLFSVFNSPEMESIAIEVLRSGRIAGGEYVPKFESGLARLLDVEHVVTTVDMTSAIHLALYLSGVRAGDEVITSPFACLATNSPIAAMGATAVWSDVSPQSVCIDAKSLLSLITAKTKAVILYHVAGYPGPVAEIARICREHGIALIEDCDNALLAKYEGKNVGAWGDFAVYSFYPNRQINTTEGGALVCRTPESAADARRLRRLGINLNKFRRADGEINPAEDIVEAGWAYTMNNFCAALGFVQLSDVEIRVAKARRHAAYLDERFMTHASIKLIKPLDQSVPAYWVYLISTPKRDEVLATLKKQGISASILHNLNSTYSCFNEHISSRNLPNSIKLQASIMALPCGWWLDNTDVKYIADIVLAAA
ncbi:DegT/DnrJ/EryC1/StrS aminotransferase family protein [Deefgea sp. CFH1-16]|uniref:DegT/DnrJ/EryC1/StrS family aminotransferase n=1 Tax=Deefgea sp. CFH1-16 TaxID=2675457 RepID=UPI0015F3BF3B|nr:aminotransferase class V-fold PLP-dependent enzyme [Deefgea sp. CFH1-16]MBM5573554.1 aminotransferase class V-fold PLP-dependent enzyme [Deefgea sp. CFH1-16]